MKNKKGRIKITYSFTDKIAGWEVNLNSISEHVIKNREHFQNNRSWEFLSDSILQGIDWSIEKIKSSG